MEPLGYIYLTLTNEEAVLDTEPAPPVTEAATRHGGAAPVRQFGCDRAIAHAQAAPTPPPIDRDAPGLQDWFSSSLSWLF